VILSAENRGSLDRLLGLWDDLVDPRVGIVQAVAELPTDDDDPDLFHYMSKACDTSVFTPLSNFSDNGGASMSRLVAIAKALGEAVERYCSALYRRDELRLARYADLEEPAVDPEALVVYRPEQFGQPGFPWRPLHRESPVRWTGGTSLATGEPILLPASLVWLPFHYPTAERSTPFCQPISTGLACGCSFEEAALSGLCEVIERDAFTITWQAGLGRPQLRVETLSDRNYDLVERFERTGSTVTLLNITTDVGVPTMLAVLQSEADHCPALVVAASADLDPEEAVRKSLEELAHTRRYSQQVKTRLPRLPREGLRDVVDQMDHLNFWCDHANAALSEFLLRSGARTDFDDIQSLATGDADGDLAVLIDKVRAIGHRVVLCDLTTPDVAGLGFAVVRALVPGFHPLFMGFAIRALGGRRLREVPEMLGGPSMVSGSGDSGLPHPYP
jgi:ribosomal protein S12 methylthiotransferase accessory factor